MPGLAPHASAWACRRRALLKLAPIPFNFLNLAACTRCLTNKSAIAKHSWTNDHPINWAETKILQRASHTMELVMKEALSIQTTSKDARFNRESADESLACASVLRCTPYRRCMVPCIRRSIAWLSVSHMTGFHVDGNNNSHKEVSWIAPSYSDIAKARLCKVAFRRACLPDVISVNLLITCG